MELLNTDLELALDRVRFAKSLGFDPDPWQEDVLRSESRSILLNCSRQSGKSTVAALLAVHRATYHPGSLILALAPSERQSKELYGKIADLYKALHGAIPPESDRKLGMILPSGSRIEALPGTEKTVRGFSGAALLLIDEAARIDDNLYYALRPMVATSGGTIVLLSTPYGKRGAFYDEWHSSADWDRYEVPASECPRIPRAFLELEKASMPERAFRQEYGCEFAETDDQVFRISDIEGAISSEVKPLFPHLIRARG